MTTELISTIIPQVPEKWIIDKIKHQVEDKPYSIVDGPFGTQLHNDEYVDEGIPVIRIVNLNYNGQFDPKKLVFITEEKYQTLKRSSIEKGDLIIAKTGATIGKVGVFEGYEKGIIASSCLKISLNSNISSDFFKYYLISDYCQKQIILSSSGSTRDTINMEQISNLKLALPQDIIIQQQIANYLDKKTAEIDETISKNQQLIELLKEKRAALINHIVTKGLNPNVPMKDSGVKWIGEIPKHWKIDCLKHNIILNALTLTDTTDSNYEFDYVDIGSVSLEKGIEKYEHMIFEDSPSRARRIVKKDDVIISTVRTYLKAIAIIPDKENIIVSTGFAVLTPTNINSRYLGYMVKSEYFTNLVSAYSVGVSYPAINSTDLINLDIVIPPDDEQKQIADYLDKEISNINNIINNVSHNINLLEEYKTSLIHHVVTGKIDVRGEEI